LSADAHLELIIR